MLQVSSFKPFKFIEAEESTQYKVVFGAKIAVSRVKVQGKRQSPAQEVSFGS